MKRLYYICAQPASIYYAWQLEVMITNFLKNGIQPDQIHIVLGETVDYNEKLWTDLYSRYPGVTFGLYPDYRTSRLYIPSLRPHILKKHFAQHPYLQSAAVFYHDCDMVFTKPVDWSEFVDDDTWYLSNTISYVGAKYIKSKQLDIFSEMCGIVGIDAEFVESQEENSGGAQYIMKNVTSDFWNKVENDCELLTAYFVRKSQQPHTIENYHPIQTWTADMWAVLWNGWTHGHNIRVTPELNFCWGTDVMEKWNNCKIFHNAGVMPTSVGMFYKARYTDKYPTDLNVNDFNPDRCSYNYVKQIIDTLQ